MNFGGCIFVKKRYHEKASSGVITGEMHSPGFIG